MMNKSLLIIILTIVSISTFAQNKTTKKVSQVIITDANNEQMPVPQLGEKHLLIFYPDPEVASQNSHLTDYLEENQIESDSIYAFGIVNLKDAPFFPNSLVRFISRQKIKKTGAQIFFDPNHAIKNGWNLGEVDDTFTIMFITKDLEIAFLKRGYLTESDIVEFYRVIDKYK